MHKPEIVLTKESRECSNCGKDTYTLLYWGWTKEKIYPGGEEKILELWYPLCDVHLQEQVELWKCIFLEQKEA